MPTLNPRPGDRDVAAAAAALAERLPEPLRPLAAVAYNYRWAWADDGPGLFGRMRDWLATFMAGRGFPGVADMKGRVSFSATDDPASAERAAYLKTLQSWTAPGTEAERAIS